MTPYSFLLGDQQGLTFLVLALTQNGLGAMEAKAEYLQ